MQVGCSAVVVLFFVAFIARKFANIRIYILCNGLFNALRRIMYLPHSAEPIYCVRPKDDEIAKCRYQVRIDEDRTVWACNAQGSTRLVRHWDRY